MESGIGLGRKHLEFLDYAKSYFRRSSQRVYDGKVLRRSSRFGFGWHQEIGSANEGVERMKGKKRVRMWGWDIGNGWKTVAAISPFRDSQNTEKRRGTARLYPGVAPRCVAGLDRF